MIRVESTLKLPSRKNVSDHCSWNDTTSNCDVKGTPECATLSTKKACDDASTCERKVPVEGSSGTGSCVDKLFDIAEGL